MNRKILEHWMSREINKEEDRYIFISDNKRICEAIMTVNFCSVYITSVSGDFFDLDGFKGFLSDRLYGFDLDQFVFVTCCLRKKTNDSIEDFCKMHRLDVKSSGWTIFREKEYLTKYEYQDELEQTLKSYVRRFEGPEIYCENLRQFHTYSENDVPRAVKDFKIVEYLLESVTMFVIEGESYVYQGGVYKKDIDGIYLMSLIQSLIEPVLIKAATIERIYRLLVIQKKVQRRRDELNAYPSCWINFKNGMLDVKEWKMLRHDPKYLAINQIPHEFDPTAVPAHPEETTFNKYLALSVPNEEDQMMLLQYMGYSMTIDTRFQKMMMITGEAGTGKSQIISLIQHIVGDENGSSLSIQDLTLRFYPATLYGKLLNACADIKGGTLNDVSNLKKATGEDVLTYEEKYGGVSFFRSYAKLLFSANEIPLNMDEKSNAFYRRLLILSMNHVLKEDEKDMELLIKLKRETKYIIYLAARAANGLYKSGKFTESENSKEQVHILYRAADSVKAFLDECMERDSDSRIKRSVLYELYRNYCEEYGRTAHIKKVFFSAIEKKGYQLKKMGEWYFVGLKQKEEEFLPCDDNPFRAKND